MPAFSQRSLDRLRSCHPDLQAVFLEVIKEVDVTILCGFRNQADQDEAFAQGMSKLRWPESRHNSKPSQAVDVAPWPINWDDHQSFRKLAVVVERVAARLGIQLVWGGDWRSFPDLPHWELPRRPKDPKA